MDDQNQEKKRSDADAALEREIRAERMFTLTEAIGRLAGPGSMKGASPVTRKQQVEIEIETWLRHNLADAEGALGAVLLRRIKGSSLLLNTQEQPLHVLASYCQRVVGSEALLREFVREVDIEWGRAFDERPRLEKEGAQPHSDDPYTVDSVLRNLSALVAQLQATSPTQESPVNDRSDA
jgi:hypothetical protein